MWDKKERAEARPGFMRNKVQKQQALSRTNSISSQSSASKASGLHRLPRDVRRRRNALHPQLELIGVRGALHSGLVIHQPRLDQIPELLIDSLHPFLLRARSNRLAD